MGEVSSGEVGLVHQPHHLGQQQVVEVMLNLGTVGVPRAIVLLLRVGSG